MIPSTVAGSFLRHVQFRARPVALQTDPRAREHLGVRQSSAAFLPRPICRPAVVLAIATAALLFGTTDLSLAAAPRALPQGQLPKDHRLNPPKDLDGYFPFQPSADPAAWAKRADHVRLQMQVALGLWPALPKSPLNAVIHGKIDRDDYTVEKVYFESVPGFFVTGNLYRPKGKTGPMPGVLCPHGHWDNGRFLDYGPDRVRQEIAQGAERFEEGGRSVLQARCVQLARMGCVVFHYDMIGYADSQQLSFDLAHRFAEQRPDMNAPSGWGLFSPRAEAHLQSIMGLQTWNSIRSLDFLLTLPEVDPKRIAVTGASGGGTQTFVLCALDPRPAVAFPAVMVSTAMQGGCTCENACLLRVDTGNVEFAALFAPKPLGLTAANDWTKEMAAKGFPELKQHYAMMGAKDNVMLKPAIHFDHNYNAVSRSAMYGWLNRHFKLGAREPIIEKDYKRLTRDEMSVWDDQHPKPDSGPAFERKLLRQLADHAQVELDRASDSPDAFRQLAGKAMTIVVGRALAEAGPADFLATASQESGEYTTKAGLVRNAAREEELPVVLVQPKQPSGRVVIWLTDSGKDGLFSTDSAGAPQPKPEIRKLLAAGCEVVGVDLLFQGEFLADAKPLSKTPRVNNPRQAAAYTFGYNHSVCAQRAQDILTILSYLQARPAKPRSIALAALDQSAPIAAAALSLAGDSVGRAALLTSGFRFGSVREIHDPNFLPGGAKYGDVPGMLALAAPNRLWVAGESNTALDLTRKLYAKASATENLTLSSATAHEAPMAAADWLAAGD